MLRGGAEGGAERDVTTARVIGPDLDDHRRPDGRRVLDRALTVDVGEHVVELNGVQGCKRNVADDGLVTTRITVPEGFDTDYSSIPAFALTLMGRWDRHDIAGVAHDWLYHVGAPRGPSDRVWRIIARSGARRVGPIRGLLGWAGLRVGGWVAYRQHSSERSSERSGESS